MKRLAMMLAVMACAALAATARDVRNAYACSGPPTWEQIAGADVVIEGRLTAAIELPSESDRLFRAFEITVDVLVVHKHAAAGTTLVVRTQVPTDVPVMCPQWDRNETFTGKYFIGAIGTDSSGGKSITRWSTAFLGAVPEGADYERGLRMAQIATGSNPAAPQLRPLDSAVACAQQAVLVGRQFKPYAIYTLLYPGAFAEDGDVRVTADDRGNFKVPLKGFYGECPEREISTYVWALEGEIDEFSCCDVPAALAKLNIRPRNAPPGPPVAGAGLALQAGNRGVPWGDVLLVTILLMAFAGGTVAIVRSSRRR